MWVLRALVLIPAAGRVELMTPRTCGALAILLVALASAVPTATEYVLAGSHSARLAEVAPLAEAFGMALLGGGLIGLGAFVRGHRVERR
jgi:hypothetical protein